MSSPENHAAVHGNKLSCSDSDLIIQFKRGDDSAFSAIVVKYQERIIRVALNMVGDEDDALDVAQDVFVKAYFHMKSFREESSLYTWLYRILCNLCLSSFRRKKIVSFVSLKEAENVTAHGSTPDDDFERKEIRGAVNRALKRLSQRQRMVFVMRQVDGLKHAEIAEIFGITEGAVKASYFQAVSKLRGMLKNFGEDYGLR